MGTFTRACRRRVAAATTDQVPRIMRDTPHASTHRHRCLLRGRGRALLSDHLRGGRAASRRARSSRGLDARGVEYVRSHRPEREEINRIIMDELVYGVFKPEAVACFQRVIGRMKDEGCDAVVLGCTEIPLIMNDSNSPLPTLDSTRLLARAALLRAVQVAAAPAESRR